MNHIHHYSANRVIPGRADDACPVRQSDGLVPRRARTEGSREVIRDNREVLRCAQDDGEKLIAEWEKNL
jgi:hypothetical protein